MSIGDLATILTVAGVSIYVLGLIGLAIPIRREFTGGDISTAWYAVSLVPKTVVAGQGARLWLRWPVTFAGLLFLVIVALRSLFTVFPFNASYTLRFITWLLFISAVFMYVGYSLGWRRRVITLSSFLAPLVVGFWLAGASVSMLAYPEAVDFVIGGLPFEDWLALHLFFPPGGDPPILRGIVVLLIGSLFLGVPFALAASAPLPSVRIVEQPDSRIEGVAVPLEGWLVAHSDGFWHLFPRIPTDENEEHRDFGRRDLISIPDDKTVVVRTFGEEVAPAKGSSEADGQQDAEGARPETEQGGEV